MEFLVGYIKFTKKNILIVSKIKNNNKKISWKNLNKLVCSLLIRFVEKSHLKLFSKENRNPQEIQLPSTLPKNCSYEDGGPDTILKSSKIVVCFNSTVVLKQLLQIEI